MNGNKITTDKKQRAIELRADGWTYRAIAQELNMGKSAVADIIREEAEAVETLEAMRLEALYQAARVTHEARIEALSLLRQKLLDEVESRDLTELPTKEVYSLLLNVLKAAKDEVKPLVILSTDEQEAKKESRQTDGYVW